MTEKLFICKAPCEKVCIHKEPHEHDGAYCKVCAFSSGCVPVEERKEPKMKIEEIEKELSGLVKELSEFSASSFNKISALRKELESFKTQQPEETYSVGDMFRLGVDECVLATICEDMLNFIVIKSGHRWGNGFCFTGDAYNIPKGTVEGYLSSLSCSNDWKRTRKAGE